MMAVATDNGPTLAEIGDLCRTYAAARERLAEVSEEIRELRRKAVRARLRGLKARVADVSATRDALRETVEAAPHLFGKPRTRSLEGVKVGYRKMPGRVECADEARAIARIRERMLEREDELVRVRESLNLGALRRLGGRELASVGVRIVDVDDEVVIATAPDDLDKLVDALLEDGESE